MAAAGQMCFLLLILVPPITASIFLCLFGKHHLKRTYGGYKCVHVRSANVLSVYITFLFMCRGVIQYFAIQLWFRSKNCTVSVLVWPHTVSYVKNRSHYVTSVLTAVILASCDCHVMTSRMLSMSFP